VHQWHRLAAVLKSWYDEIGTMVKTSGVLHADETGWRVNGKTHWLWAFTTQNATYYVIDKSRASPVVLRFFKKAFAGILVTDFWGAYNAIVCAGKQKCLAHLLGDLKKVAKYKDKSEDWPVFAKRLKRHRDELFVFLYHVNVPFDNNHAERTIRNAVVMRKNSYCNRSTDGAETQAILMSVFQTLKQNNANVTKTVVNALHHHLETKKLSNLNQLLKISAE